MSAIYFVSERREVVLRGNERALFGQWCSDLLWLPLQSLMDTWHPEKSEILNYLPANSYARQTPSEMSLKLYLTSLMSGSIWLDGKEYDCFSLALNSALVAGSDPIKLGARLHGQCEIHAYVEGPNRMWLADMIVAGRRKNIFRPDMGWENVRDLLVESNRGPVVTSYSVCEGFPNAHIAGWETNNDYDDWYDLPDDEKWKLALEGLHATEERELSPETWDTFYFTHGMDGFRLAEIITAREHD